MHDLLTDSQTKCRQKFKAPHCCGALP